MEMSELGVANYLKTQSPAKDDISQREAYRRFGSARVKRWKEKDLLHKIRIGETERSKILYSYSELLAIATAEKMRGVISKQNPRLRAGI